LREDIEVEKSKLRSDNGIKRVIANVTFERGGKVKARFTFAIKFRRELQFSKAEKDSVFAYSVC